MDASHGAAETSLGDFFAVAEKRPKDVMDVSVYDFGARAEGFWAATRLRHRVDLKVQEMVIEGESSFPMKGNADWKLQLGEFLASKGTDPAIIQSLLASGKYERIERVLWFGYLHNAASLLALVLLIRSLAWIPEMPAKMATSRRDERLARGVCPSCEYSIAGLVEPKCPECGCVWEVPGKISK